MPRALLGSDCLFFFFFNDTATTEIYTLSLHDALPICPYCSSPALASNASAARRPTRASCRSTSSMRRDRKSTRLNSSHLVISYAVFCLKKKNFCALFFLTTILEYSSKHISLLVSRPTR